jgi:hypothetical protein
MRVVFGHCPRDQVPDFTLHQVSAMTSASLILRRLDEIERKLDRMMEELRPTAIGYSVRRGNLPRKN